jgi:hypothetical protein
MGHTINFRGMNRLLIVCSFLAGTLFGCAVNIPPSDPAYPFPLPDRSQSGGQVGGVSPIPPPTTRVFVSNKFIRLGIDPNLGGGITYLSEVGQPNMVNNYDYGRQIQTSIFGGPIPYGQSPEPALAGSGWNPIQVGDYRGTPAGSIEWRKIDSTRLYVKSNGIQWHLINSPGHCVMEHWYEIRDNTVRVKSRTTINRPDQTFYNPTYQEAPAIYLNTPYRRFTYYGGTRPYANAALSAFNEVTNKPVHHTATEEWVAMVNSQSRGLGLYHPGLTNYANNSYGEGNSQGEFDFSGVYMTGLPVDQIDYNGVYEYEYVLILGSVDDIRRFVYNQPRPRTVPDFVFDTGRKGWSYYNTRDQGWPIRNTMDVQWEGTKPEMFRVSSPFVFFPAADAPKLYVQAAFTTNATSARLIWTRIGDRDYRDKANQEVSFPINGDGQMRTYEVDLSRVGTWQGHITRFAIEPITHEGLQKGGQMKLKSVTATRP